MANVHGQTPYFAGLPMQNRCLSPRMNKRLSATAGVDETVSPTVFFASNLNFGAASNTYTAPFLAMA